MTCVIGCLAKDRVYIATDGRLTTGYTIASENQIKIFNKNGFVIAGAGSLANTMIFDYALNTLKFPEKVSEQDAYNFLYYDLTNAVKNEFKRREVKDTEYSFSCLMAYKTKLFNMSRDFSLYECNNFTSVGSGSYHATASFATLQLLNKYKPFSKYEMKNALKTSLSIANKFDTGTGINHYWINTHDLKLEEL